MVNASSSIYLIGVAKNIKATPNHYAFPSFGIALGSIHIASHT